MAQSLSRWEKARPQSFYDTVRERIDMTMAVEVVNDVLKGKDIPTMRANTALSLVMRAIPALQAISMQLDVTEPASRHDIDALLLSSGLRPDLLPGWKKSAVLEHSQADPLPPERESE